VAEMVAEQRIIGMLKVGLIQLHVFEELKQEWELKGVTHFDDITEKYVIHFPDALDRCFQQWVTMNPDGPIGSRSGFVKNMGNKGFHRVFTKGVNATRVEASRWWYKCNFSMRLDVEFPELVQSLIAMTNQIALSLDPKSSPKQKRRATEDPSQVLSVDDPYAIVPSTSPSPLPRSSPLSVPRMPPMSVPRVSPLSVPRMSAPISAPQMSSLIPGTTQGFLPNVEAMSSNSASPSQLPLVYNYVPMPTGYSTPMPLMPAEPIVTPYVVFPDVASFDHISLEFDYVPMEESFGEPPALSNSMCHMFRELADASILRGGVAATVVPTQNEAFPLEFTWEESPPSAEAFSDIEKLFKSSFTLSYYEQEIMVENQQVLPDFLDKKFQDSKNGMLRKPDRRRLLRGRIGNKLVGCAEIHLKKGNNIYLAHMAIDPEMWGTGYGKIFMGQLMSQIRKCRPDKNLIWGVVRRSNHRAMKFYQNLGAKINEKYIKRGYDPNAYVLMYWGEEM